MGMLRVGCGSTPTDGEVQNRPSNATGFCDHMVRIRSNASVPRAYRSSNGAERTSNSSRSQPMPAPSSVRPPLNASSVASCLPSNHGSRCGTTTTSEPTAIRDVCALIQVMLVIASQNAWLTSAGYLPPGSYGYGELYVSGHT